MGKQLSAPGSTLNKVSRAARSHESIIVKGNGRYQTGGSSLQPISPVTTEGSIERIGQSRSGDRLGKIREPA